MIIKFLLFYFDVYVYFYFKINLITSSPIKQGWCYSWP